MYGTAGGGGGGASGQPGLMTADNSATAVMVGTVAQRKTQVLQVTQVKFMQVEAVAQSNYDGR